MTYGRWTRELTALLSMTVLGIGCGGGNGGNVDDATGSATSTGTGSATETATATATATEDATSTATATSTDRTVQSITLSPASGSVDAGSSLQLTATMTYSDGSTGTAPEMSIWESSAPDVATVDGFGKVTGVSAGSATITVTVDDVSATATVTVNAVEVTEFVVFDDDFKNGETYAAFDGTPVSFVKDTAVNHSGSASLRFDFATGGAGWMGGAFNASASHDLSAFNALTFWAKASKATTVNVVGVGISGADASAKVERPAIAVGTDWTYVVVPLPDAAKLADTDAMFHYADDVDGGYTLWIDDVKYEKNVDVGTANPVMATESATLTVGGERTLNGRGVNYVKGAETVHVDVAGGYFSYQSSDAAVASVSAIGVVSAVSPGAATITAQLGASPVAGSLDLTVNAPPLVMAPTDAAPSVTVADGDAISLLGDLGDDVSVSTWRTGWSGGSLEDVTIAGAAIKKYVFTSSAAFVGIEFPLINATAMTHFHADIWTPDAASLEVKLVDYSSGSWNPSTNLERVATVASVTKGSWQSLDLSLDSDFAGGLTPRANVAQLLFVVPAGGTVFVDNVYFHK